MLSDNSLPNMMIQSKTNNHLSIPVLSEIEGINNHLAFGISTTVVSALQINSFMQNKPKFRKSQMNVNKVLTKEYENKTLGERGKKQSQTNPNKAKFKKAEMNVTSIITKDYENISNWAICENEPKTNPIKANTNPISHQRTTNNEQRTNNKQSQCLSAISVAGQRQKHLVFMVTFWIRRCKITRLIIGIRNLKE